MEDWSVRIYAQAFGQKSYEHIMNLKFAEADDVGLSMFRIEKLLIERVDGHDFV